MKEHYKSVNLPAAASSPALPCRVRGLLKPGLHLAITFLSHVWRILSPYNLSKEIYKSLHEA